MINLLPTSSVQSFQVRCNATASYTPFQVVMHWANTQTNRTFTIYPTASINSNDFLSVTASYSNYLSGSNEFNFQITQLSGSTECTELYRGVALSTTESVLTADSIPFFSYTGSKTEYIIF
jgi:hypothetical protein